MSVGLLQGRGQGAGDAPAWRPALRNVLRRLRSLVHPVTEDSPSGRLECLGQVCAVLQDARTIVERGWLQDAWYVMPAGSAGAPAVEALGILPPRGAEVSAACMVGAVVQATRQLDPAADVLDAGPALDVLWDALQESRGLGGPGVAGRAAPRDLRAARVRDLTRWNDRPGRTSEDVLGLFDLAASRAIMEAMVGRSAE
jgi:hypothetical protein